MRILYSIIDIAFLWYEIGLVSLILLRIYLGEKLRLTMYFIISWLGPILTLILLATFITTIRSNHAKRKNKISKTRT